MVCFSAYTDQFSLYYTDVLRPNATFSDSVTGLSAFSARTGWIDGLDEILAGSLKTPLYVLLYEFSSRRNMVGGVNVNSVYYV